MVTENAIIENVHFGFRDYGCLTLDLQLKLPHSGGVIFGGFNLGHQRDEAYKRDNGNNVCFHYINKVFKIAGAEDFDDLVGKPIRAIFDGNTTLGSKVIGIQHFLEDDKFIPSEEYKQ